MENRSRNFRAKIFTHQLPRLRPPSSSFSNEGMVLREQIMKVDEKSYTKKPHCSLASIISQDSQHSINVGTGVLISPNLILTSAHNIYQIIDQGKKLEEYQSVRYLLAGKGNVTKDSYNDVLQWRYEKPQHLQQKSSDVKSDYALMLLSQLHSYDHCMELTICCEHCTFDLSKQKNFAIYGYPSPNNEQKFENYKGLQQGKQFILDQWGRQQPKRLIEADFTDNKLCYQLSTFSGQSGSAVLYGNKLVAIHKAGGRKQKRYNIGRMITLDMVEKLVDWTIQINAQPFRLNDTDLCHHLKKKVALLQLRLMFKKRVQINFGQRDQTDSKQIIEHLIIQNQQILRKSKKQKSQLQQQNLSLKETIETLEAKMRLQRSTFEKQIQQLNNKLNQQKNNDKDKDKDNKEQNEAWNKLGETRLKQMWRKKQQQRIKAIQQQQRLNEKKKKEQQILRENKKKEQNNLLFQHLDLSCQSLSQVYLNEYTLLKTLYLQGNNIKHVDLSRNMQLTDLLLQKNKISKIDLSFNIKLVRIDLSHNQLNEVNLPKSKELTTLHLNNNQLKNFSLFENTRLATIYLQANRLQYLILWFNPSMPWNYNKNIYGIFLYNQYSKRCEVTFICNQKLERACEIFLQQGREGFQQAKCEEGWYNNYWENQYKCNYLFVKQIKSDKSSFDFI